MISRPTMSVTISLGLVDGMSRVEIRMPSRKTVTRSHSSNTSSSLWLTYRTPLPMPFNRRITSKSCFASFGVSAEVGSSMMTTFASWDSARAISTICCWDTVSRPTCSIGSRSRPIESRIARVRVARAFQSMVRLRRSGKDSRKTFSATDRPLISASSWNTTLIPLFRESWAERISMGSPSKRISPESF